MRLFFISNTTKPTNVEVPQHSIEGWVCTNTWKRETAESNQVDDIALLAAAGDDDLVYVIDVHCKFSRLNGDKASEIDNLQEHGGVVIYRHLLHELSGMQEKLRVVFYSPIDRKNLVALKPENYILMELPFISWSGDGKFGETLSKLINSKNSEGWPRVNNASENMLSGWAAANRKTIREGQNPEQIDLHKNKALVIDDEWDDWQITYNKILSVEPDYFLSPLVGESLKQEYRKLKTMGFDHIGPDTFRDYKFIISDLYLHERHETDKLKTDEFARTISGFRLFRKIRASNVEPAIPVIFHTTSTKFKIYEMLRAFGSGGQVNKHNSHKASLSEKLHVYLALKESLEGITDEFSTCWRREIYDSLTTLFVRSYLRKIVSSKAKSETLAEVKGLLKNLLLIRGQDSGLDDSYIGSYFENFEINPLSFNAVSVVRSVGLIPETLNKNLGKGNVGTPELTFALHLRNHASHATNYGLFSPFDADLVTILVTKSLSEARQRKISVSFPDKRSDFWNNEDVTHPIFDYVHYYNHCLSYVPDRLKVGLCEKIKTLSKDYVSSGKWQTLSKAYKNELSNKVDENNRPKFSIKQGNFREPFFFSGANCILQLPG